MADPARTSRLAQRIPVLRPQLLRLRADVLCLQEVNGQEHAGQPRDLAALDELLQGTPYAAFARAHTRTGNQAYDERNLVVLSRFPILGSQQLRNDLVPPPQYRKVTAAPAEPARDVTWERPILHVRVDLGAGRTLHVVCVHLKSRLPTSINGQQHPDRYWEWRSAKGWAEGYFLSSMKRVGQALEVRHLVDQIQDADANAFVAIAGDFNDDLESVPVLAIRGRVEETGNPALLGRELVPCENSIPDSLRYSLFHLGRGNMLDHVLASRPMLAWYRHTEVHNETLSDESGAFRTDTAYPGSDHAPVVAEFDVP